MIDTSGLVGGVRSHGCSVRKDGYVYVLDVLPGQDLYKVGWTENLESRLPTHHRTYPFLRVLFTAPSYQDEDAYNRYDFFRATHGIRVPHSTDIRICCPELVPAAIERMARRLAAS